MKPWIKYLFRTQDELEETDIRSGIRSLTGDGICSMSMITLQGGPFLPAFAIALGASNYEVGLLVTIAFVSQLMQLPGLYLARKIPVRRATVLIAAGCSRLLWVFIILIPFLFVDRGVAFLMQWLFVAAMIGALAGPAWNSLLRDIVPEQEMGSVFARRMLLGNGAVLAIMIGGGYFVDFWVRTFPDSSLYAYSILFVIGLLFGLAGLLVIARMPEPRRPEPSTDPILKSLVKPLKDANFRAVIVFIAVWSFAVNMAAPFFIVYMLTRIGLPLKTVTLLFVVSLVTNMIFLRIWGRLGDRYSSKSVLAVSAPLFLFAILGWTFTTMPERYALTLPILVLIHVLSGMSLSGISLATMNLALKMSPKGDAHSYMTVYGVIAACSAALAPMFAGLLADFFAVREFSISFNWADPARDIALPAFNISALDFLFVLAFVVGLFAVRRLRFVKEAGEVKEQVVRDELRNEVLGSLRDVSMIPGIRHLVTLPIAGVVDFVARGGIPRKNKPPAREVQSLETDEETSSCH